MSKKLKTSEANVSDMRRCLKEMMNREIANLPNLIEQLPPEQRIDKVIRILPFFIPQVNKVGSSLDPMNWGGVD